MGSLTKKNLEEICISYNLNLNDFYFFVETGSHVGATIDNMLPYFNKLITIEIAENYFNIVKGKFSEIQKVTCLRGDSSDLLKNLNLDKNENVVFWLDGHYSSGDTGKGIKDCPLLEELKIIDNLYFNSLIIIDDYRLFGTNHSEDWVDITYENVMMSFKKNNVKKIESFGDRLVILI
jgi:hypothetical protein